MRYLVTLIALVSTSFPATLMANGAPTGIVGEYSGMTLAPIKGEVFRQQKFVALLDEELTITLGPTSYRVKVVYRFKNSGKKRKVRVAFPFMAPVNGFRVAQDNRTIKASTLRQHSDIIGYYLGGNGDEPVPIAFGAKDSSVQDAELVKYLEKHRFSLKGGEEDGWQVMNRLRHNPAYANFKLFTLRFGRKQSRVEIIYDSAYGNERIDMNTDELPEIDDYVYARLVSYVLETGRYWKGCLRSLKITVNLGTFDPRGLEVIHGNLGKGTRTVLKNKTRSIFVSYSPTIRPGGWQLSGSTLCWKLGRVCLAKKHNLQIRLLKPKSYPSRFRKIKVHSSSIRSAMSYLNGFVFGTLLGKQDRKSRLLQRQKDLENYDPKSPFLGGGRRLEPKPRLPYKDYARRQHDLIWGAARYSPIRAIDPRWPVSGWCEGVRGPGVGQWISFRYPKSQNVKTLSLIPGWGIGRRAWRKHPRISKLAIALDGKAPFVVTLRDRPGSQSVKLPSAFRSIRLQVRGVFRGKSGHTCIRKLRFR